MYFIIDDIKKLIFIIDVKKIISVIYHIKYLFLYRVFKIANIISIDLYIIISFNKKHDTVDL